MFLNIIMFQSRIILIFLLFCLSQFVKIDGQSFNYYSFTYHKCSNRSADLVGNSVYKQNLNKLFRTLSKRASVIRFYNTTVGESREKVYGLFQCAEKYANLDCPNCIGFAIDEIVQLCPSYDEAIVWDKNCMLRYAKRPIFSVPEVAPLQVDLESYESSLNRPQFESSALSIKMRDLINNASFSNTSIHFAHHKIKLMPYSFDTYAQCTRDLNGIQCKSCLDSALTELHTCCKSIIDGNIFMPSCQLWKQFVYHDDGAADAPVPIDNSGKPLGAPVIAGLITILVGTVLLFNALLCYLQWRRRTKNRSKDIHNELPDGEVKEIRSLKDLQFDFHTIKAATKNFAEDKKLGEGGFGEVYKGKLKNGREIAVKMLSKNSEQGTKEFKNEVLLLAKLQHRHLVQLLGFCISGKEKMLIYELVPNSSLDCFLFDPHKSSSLDWQTRLRIIDGVARGILYLHEDSRLKIIHRDLKTSNILLDQVLNAKISDFGLAKLFALDETQGCTTRVVGTYGYMAPEYAMAGQFSVKSDVYSFGVIVLEIISGQKNRVFQQQPNEEALLYRAWRLWNEDAALELVDPIIRKNTINDADEILICIHIALLCIQEDPTNRPRMASVVAALNGQSISLPPPLSPHFFRVSPATYTDLSSYDSNSGNEIQSLSVQSLTDEYSRTISQIMG